MEHKPKKKQNQKVKVPLFAVMLYLLLIAVALSGISFSKYVAGTRVGNSARVAQIKNISILETGSFTHQDKWIITPGVNMSKNATVRFEGSEMACYIFLRIKTTGWNLNGDFSFVCSVDGNNALSFSVDDTVWKFLCADENDAVYYAVVSANTPFEALVLAHDGTITVSKDLTRTQLDKLASSLAEDISIDIEAVAMQYHGVEEVMEPEYDETKRAKTAWDLVKQK